MKILADECCDDGLVQALADAGHDLLSVAAHSPGAADADVLELAVGSRRLLLTEDRDFGELVFAGQSEHEGVLYVRFPGTARQAMIRTVTDFVGERGESLLGSFTVQFHRAHSSWCPNPTSKLSDQLHAGIGSERSCSKSLSNSGDGAASRVLTSSPMAALRDALRETASEHQSLRKGF